MKRGLIYKSGVYREPVGLAGIVEALKAVARWLVRVGRFLMVLAVVGAVYIYLPLGIAWINYSNHKVTKELVVEDNNYAVFVPKIGALAAVIPNVDANSKEAYGLALRAGVAEAAGMAHPGEMGTTLLFAHSVGDRIDFARYNAVFYLLDKLGLGDTVEIVYKGKLLRYEVVRREILEPENNAYFKPQKLSEQLVLQTCWPPGTTWKRLVVVGRRI